jgi:signal peptidase
MTTISVSAPATTRPVASADEAAAGHHRRAGATRGFAPWSVARKIVRFAVGLALAVAALASIALTAFIVVEHVGFSPVLSPSMEPTFAPGDLIVTKPIAAADIRVGEVVVLPVPGQHGERYVHRVVKVTYEHGFPVVRTKGDNNPAPEDFQLRITSKTVPVVVHTVPHAGRLALLFRAGAWRIAAIVLVGGLFLVGLKRALLDR